MAGGGAIWHMAGRHPSRLFPRTGIARCSVARGRLAGAAADWRISTRRVVRQSFTLPGHILHERDDQPGSDLRGWSARCRYSPAGLIVLAAPVRWAPTRTAASFQWHRTQWAMTSGSKWRPSNNFKCRKPGHRTAFSLLEAPNREGRWFAPEPQCLPGQSPSGYFKVVYQSAGVSAMLREGRWQPGAIHRSSNSTPGWRA